MVNVLNGWINEEAVQVLREQYLLHNNATVQGVLKVDAVDSATSVVFKSVSNPLMYVHSYAKPPAWASSKELEVFVSKIVGKSVKISNLQLTRFQKGDYTLLYDNLEIQKHPMIVISWSRNWKPSWGGFVSFLDKDEEVLRVEPQDNSITIINATNLRFFVKYVNHRAKGEVTFLFASLKPK